MAQFLFYQTWDTYDRNRLNGYCVSCDLIGNFIWDLCHSLTFIMIHLIILPGWICVILFYLVLTPFLLVIWRHEEPVTGRKIENEADSFREQFTEEQIGEREITMDELATMIETDYPNDKLISSLPLISSRRSTIPFICGLHVGFSIMITIMTYSAILALCYN